MVFKQIVALLISNASAGSANVVDLEVRNNNDYYGPLFVGSYYREERMIYDTSSQYITIDNDSIANAEMISNYDISESTTAIPQYRDAAKTKPLMYDLDFGTYNF